ncbi:NAD(P)-dependent oxidoreductase [Hymenobacter cellulosivorans]|uniref:SDR family oxidoreductase n=1 Tax=Hymenobacter cellulosivorans TaxID=2932249 RepID=A0ABY4FGG6_9BACT|nr:SDR family oxidoreductase [Hymenobacter cellulosivorans]UOQ55635.1 SDR family oxidoreductase [Hymenobacter cellulosivorans]
MKLLIFGATGGTGRQLVLQALEAGHSVTAFVRTPAKLALSHPRLRTLQGDVLDYAAVLAALPGHEAVLSALGAPATHQAAVRSVGTRHILQAMEATGVQRFICLTTLGMGESRAALPFSYKYFIVPLFLRRAFADSEVQETYIRQSAVAWTIARPATLTNGSRTGAYRHGFSPTTSGLKIKISRADVADFMLGQLHDTRYLRQAASLSY